MVRVENERRYINNKGNANVSLVTKNGTLTSVWLSIDLPANTKLVNATGTSQPKIAFSSESVTALECWVKELRRNADTIQEALDAFYGDHPRTTLQLG